jgi:hypothetical protein
MLRKKGATSSANRNLYGGDDVRDGELRGGGDY